MKQVFPHRSSINDERSKEDRSMKKLNVRSLACQSTEGCLTNQSPQQPEEDRGVKPLASSCTRPFHAN